jgi:GT2 family glycosyltransferase
VYVQGLFIRQIMKVSVVIVVRDESKHIKKCLEALFKQSYPDFEIIIIDNGSTDGTGEIINSFGNKRIKYFYEPARCGIAMLRNIGAKKTGGEYVFFTDGDCVTNKHWLEEGLKVLETKEYVGVEGKTYYETQEKITISDYNTCQLTAGKFMACNVAYPRDILEKVNYFDPLFKYGHEDKDLAFRVKKSGRIYFSENMLVFHQKKTLSVSALFNRARRAENMVYFIKKHGKYTDMRKNILHHKNLFVILCPPLIILGNNYRTVYDLIFGVLKYFYFVYERGLIWKAAIKNKIFVI